MALGGGGGGASSAAPFTVLSAGTSPSLTALPATSFSFIAPQTSTGFGGSMGVPLVDIIASNQALLNHGPGDIGNLYVRRGGPVNGGGYGRAGLDHVGGYLVPLNTGVLFPGASQPYPTWQDSFLRGAARLPATIDVKALADEAFDKNWSEEVTLEILKDRYSAQNDEYFESLLESMAEDNPDLPWAFSSE
eukprot:GHVS01051207.1.p1 GENE.GHVS01051207.1~~GHVS01051207.1.p1  ORF type:complete len:221 (-),score=41.14 GHVS01051207.1:359-931(-)